MAQAPEEGRILIQENNETYPLAGVNIFWLNTTIGTVSDQEGKFVIPSAASTDQLIVKYLGFKTDTLTSIEGFVSKLSERLQQAALSNSALLTCITFCAAI